MTVRALIRGNRVIYKDFEWVWEDDGSPVLLNERPCVRCLLPPTPEGHDACLGRLPGVKGACCGHGLEQPQIMKEDGGSRMNKGTVAMLVLLLGILILYLGGGR